MYAAPLQARRWEKSECPAKILTAILCALHTPSKIYICQILTLSSFFLHDRALKTLNDDIWPVERQLSLVESEQHYTPTIQPECSIMCTIQLDQQRHVVLRMPSSIVIAPSWRSQTKRRCRGPAAPCSSGSQQCGEYIRPRFQGWQRCLGHWASGPHLHACRTPVCSATHLPCFGNSWAFNLTCTQCPLCADGSWSEECGLDTFSHLLCAKCWSKLCPLYIVGRQAQSADSNKCINWCPGCLFVTPPWFAIILLSRQKWGGC